jgi:diguanylate cyclase (GGDEF)-like protein
MVASVRPRDVVCRLGGDEFLVVLVGTAEDELPEIAGRLRRMIAERPMQCRAGSISISVSLGGVAYTPGTSVDAEEALEQADQALYESKRGGRNRLSMAPREAVAAQR